jgi:hypothetical protein
MRRLWVTVVVLLLTGGAALAQQPGVRRQQLQQEVMQRLMENYRVQAGLGEEQYENLREVMLESLGQRAELLQRERIMWTALQGQMRPGVGADADSVSGLMDSLIGIQDQLVQLQRQDQQRYAEFLDPVQRAQLMLSTRRFQNNVNQIMQRRRQQGRPPGIER